MRIGRIVDVRNMFRLRDDVLERRMLHLSDDDIAAEGAFEVEVIGDGALFHPEARFMD